MDSHQNVKQESIATVDLFDLPPKPPRSKLEQHRELIRRLRRGGHTYRDIAALFLTKMGIKVAPSTIHSFVKVRAQHNKIAQFELPSPITVPASDSGAVRALQAKPQPEKSQRPRFVFRENEPLTLTNSGGCK